MRSEKAATEALTPSVTVDNPLGVRKEKEKYEAVTEEEVEKPSWKAPRMFSINQIRELFYLNLHRSELKQTVEQDHETKMEMTNQHIRQVEDITQELRELIAKEKKSVMESVETVRFDESQFRIRYNLEFNDMTNKVSIINKEIKASAQMVKLAEKQVD